MALCRNTIKGVEIEVNIDRCNFANTGQFQTCENLTDALVMFNGSKNVTVDSRASDEYALWAVPDEIRQDYKVKRLEMFRTLLVLHLYDCGATRKTFEHSIELLS